MVKHENMITKIALNVNAKSLLSEAVAIGTAVQSVSVSELPLVVLLLLLFFFT